MKYEKLRFRLILLIIIIFFLLPSFINSEECTCENNNGICDGSGCNSNCKSDLLSNSCKTCNMEGKSFYYINTDGICTPIDSCSNKIVFESNECVSSCGNKYSMGDYC